MGSLQYPRKLEQSARRVAFGRVPAGDVRIAVRDLAVGALRSRLLSIRQVARVARAIAHGIDPSQAGSRYSRKSTASGAIQGLVDAIEVALHALEVAAREFGALGGRFAPEDGSVVEDLDALEQVLRDLTSQPQAPDLLGARIHRLRGHFHIIVSSEASEGDHILGLLASGALLGLLEGAQPAAQGRGALRRAEPSRAMAGPDDAS